MTYKGRLIEITKTVRVFGKEVLNSQIFNDTFAENFTKGANARVICPNANNKRI